MHFYCDDNALLLQKFVVEDFCVHRIETIFEIFVTAQKSYK